MSVSIFLSVLSYATGLLKPIYEVTFPTHLAKRPSDLKQNGTQEKTQFSGTLSHGVPHFVASGSIKNH